MNTHVSVIKKHEQLFSGVSLNLGEIHQMLTQASDELWSRCYRKEADKTVCTELGEEVGKDEIHWWVFKRETDLDELHKKTEIALAAAQKLKEDSAKMIPDVLKSYEMLITTFARFSETHKADIESLYEYVKWLHDKNAFAPSILYTYRVWGTTRRSQRHVDFVSEEESTQRQQPATRCVEIVYGLFLDRTYTLDSVRRDVEIEMSERFATFDPEDSTVYYPIKVSESRVISQASREAVREFATYFEMTRDSLRNVLLDIDKCKEQKDLLRSDIFWMKFIKKIKDLPKPEQPQWDFKRTLDMWKRSGEDKSKADKNRAELKFAEEVASLANATGGVLIVGVTDISPRKIEGIGNDLTTIERELKYTRDVIAEYVRYPRDIFYFHLTPVEDDTGTMKNCLIIAIARACDTVAVKDKEGRFTYPIRRETGLTRIDSDDIWREKLHFKSDSFDFVQNFNQILHDK